MLSVPFEKFTLSNGLQVVLHHQPGLPLTAVNVWYHVGSKDEAPGRTGFAHLFEHLMFEGSGHHRQSYFLPLQQVGGTLNGSTASDRTNYWENVPANYLELALWLEADRLGFLLDAVDQERLDLQRSVVKNERRQSYENRPYGIAQELIRAALFPPSHPYHWMVIGSQEDLDAASLDDVHGFFRKYYTPNNASLVIAGHFDPDATRTMIERMFGDIPGGAPLSRMKEWVPVLPGSVRLTAEDRVRLPRLYLTWPSAPQFHPDEPALDLLAAVLAEGRSSRLYRAMIYDRSIAQEAHAYNHAEEIAGEFAVIATAAADHTIEEVAEEVARQLARVQQEPPTAAELDRVKNRSEAQFVRHLEQMGGFSGRADLLNHFNVYTGDPGRLSNEMDRYLAVTPDDLLRVARKYLGGPNVRLDVLPAPSLTVSLPTIDRTTVPGPSAELPFAPPAAERARLSNGMTVAVVPRHDIPVVAAGLLLPAGAISDPADKPGLASFAVRLLTEGTASRDSTAIAEALEDRGARLNAHAFREYTMLTTEALTKHWPAVLELLADVVQHPSFPAHELDRVRRERITDLRRRREDASATADKVAAVLLHGLTSPLGHPLDGTEAGLEALTRDDLAGFARRNLSPQGATFVLVGDITLADAVQQAEAAFGGWQTAPPDGAKTTAADVTPSVSSAIYLVDKPGAPQSVVRTIQPTMPRRHPDYFAMALLNYVFGGQFTARLNMNLRQTKGYSYGYNSRVEWRTAISQFVAGGAVQTAVTREAVVETLKEFVELHEIRPITADELGTAKAGVVQALPRLFETPGQVVDQLADAARFGLPDDYHTTLARNIQGVQLEDVRRLAHQHTGRDGMLIVVVGDRKEIEAGLRELELPLHIVDDEGQPVTD